MFSPPPLAWSFRPGSNPGTTAVDSGKDMVVTRVATSPPRVLQILNSAQGRVNEGMSESGSCR